MTPKEFFKQHWVHDSECEVYLTGAGKCTCHVPEVMEFFKEWALKMVRIEEKRIRKRIEELMK